MSTPVVAGDNLPLSLVLGDGAEDKFPIAFVYGGANLPVAGSPFLLTHMANGLYASSAFSVPVDGTIYTTVYRVYEDPTLLDLSYYDQAEDVFTVESGSGGGGGATPAQIWAYPTRTLTAFPNLATKADVLQAVADLTANLTEWKPELTLAVDNATDTIELLAWLTKNGTIVLDASSARIKLVDFENNVVFQTALDPSPTSEGMFEFSQPNASGLLFTSKAYVAEISVTRGSVTYVTLIGITVVLMANGIQAFSYGAVVVPAASETTPPSGSPVVIYAQPPSEAMQNFPQIFGFFVTYQGAADSTFEVDGSEFP